MTATTTMERIVDLVKQIENELKKMGVDITEKFGFKRYDRYRYTFKQNNTVAVIDFEVNYIANDTFNIKVVYEEVDITTKTVEFAWGDKYLITINDVERMGVIYEYLEKGMRSREEAIREIIEWHLPNLIYEVNQEVEKIFKLICLLYIVYIIRNNLDIDERMIKIRKIFDKESFTGFLNFLGEVFYKIGVY